MADIYEVFDAVLDEVQVQDSYNASGRQPDDRFESFGDYLLALEEIVQRARHNHFIFGRDYALDSVRRLAAVATMAMRDYGVTKHDDFVPF